MIQKKPSLFQIVLGATFLLSALLVSPAFATDSDEPTMFNIQIAGQ